MDFGVHLPLIDLGRNPYTLDYLIQYVETSEQLGFQALSANDHLIYSRPWLDGPTALAASLSHSGTMDLTTSVSLPVVRGPIQLAKALGAIDRLSGGRLIVCVGPGSSARDYAAVGIPFEERWRRLDEAIGTLRSLWSRDGPAFKGKYYDTEGIRLEPYPAQESGPAIWIGSWGSQAGLRRVAHLGDGWLASGYNTTPELFAQNWQQLQQFLVAAGKEPAPFPNALATVWLYITEDQQEAEGMLEKYLAPALNRPVEELRNRLPIGSALDCARKLAAYERVGVQRIYLWPLGDEIQQLKVFVHQVAPLMAELEGAE